MIPATRHGIFAGILSADPALMEPIYKIVVTVPPDLVGAVTRIISQKRGKILSIDQREYLTCIVGETPAVETFDLSEVMRSASGGRAFWQTTFDHWEYVPASLQMQVIQETRKRKGLSPQPPTPQQFLE
jgi:elongation factor 2